MPGMQGKNQAGGKAGPGTAQRGTEEDERAYGQDSADKGHQPQARLGKGVVPRGVAAEKMAKPVFKGGPDVVIAFFVEKNGFRPSDGFESQAPLLCRCELPQNIAAEVIFLIVPETVIYPGITGPGGEEHGCCCKEPGPAHGPA